MARKKDTPCATCGTLIWRPTKDQPPPGEAMCRKCRWNCHQEQHGTRLMYRERGCRCEKCRDYIAGYMREYVALVRERDGITPTQKCRPPKTATRPAPCSRCGKQLARTKLAEPMCATCRGVKPGANIPISRAARLAIYARDDWTCGICLEPVDPAVNPNTAWGATLDHIVPRSQGGTHDPENLRLAHRWCNSARNDLRTYTDEDFRVA